MESIDKAYVLFGEKACIEYMGLSMDSFLEYLSEETPSSYDVVFFNALEKPEIVLYAFEQYEQYAMIKKWEYLAIILINNMVCITYSDLLCILHNKNEGLTLAIDLSGIDENEKQNYTYIYKNGIVYPQTKRTTNN